VARNARIGSGSVARIGVVKLSVLSRAVPLDVVRDGDFESIGLLSVRIPGLLACLHDPRARKDAQSNRDLCCVITSPTLADVVPAHLGLAVAVAPRDRFLEAQRHLGTNTAFFGEDAPTEIAPTARVDSAAIVAPRNVRIGAGSVVEAGAIIRGRATLDEDVVVRSGAVIGAEGFHPVPWGGAQVSMPHFGSVHLERGVEVQSNAVICRAAFSRPTRIGAFTIVGPQVYVAHSATIGARCRIAASVRIAGSSLLGDDVYVGPNGVISNQVKVGDSARVSIGAVVVRDVPPGATVTGHFAVEHRRFLRAWRRFFR
jgi:UDP-3-O-[3-hydroxymyristoyl] glucosamine N-acyltransferase